MNKYDILKRIDGNTGEVLSEEFITKKETYKIKDKSRELTPQQIHFINQKDDLKAYNNSLGGFIVLYFNNLLYDKSLNLDLGNASRIIYLATYMDYHTNMLVLNNGYASGQKIIPMKKKNIKELMNLSDRAFTNFFKEVIEKNILIENEDKTFNINKKYFIKGKKIDYNQEFTRVYIDTIRELYINTNSRNHKCLTYVFKLLPYVDRQSNIVCHNPNDLYNERRKMTLKDIATFFGISTEKKNIDKFIKNNLFKIFIVKDSKKYWVFNQITVKNGGGIKDYFAINPMLFYGGNEYSQIPIITRQLLID